MDSRDLRHASAVLACLALGLLAQTTEAGVFVQCPGDTDGDGVIDVADPQHPRAVCKHLTGGDGFVKMADGRLQYIFGFSDVTGVAPDQVMATGTLAANFPAPTIALREGDEFYLTLTNVGMAMRPDLFDPHSVHFHGFPNAAPIFDGMPEGSVAINMGSSISYYYNIVEPGTYMYHCHVEAAEHMQMGMLGNLYVHPRQDGTAITYQGRTYTQFAYNDGDGSTGYDVEYPLQMGSFDPAFHDASMNVQPLPFANMKDKYAMLNGRGYPDTLVPGALTPPAENNGVPSQPINALITASTGQRILLRVSNLNVTNFYTLTALGLPMRVVGSGARMLRGPDPDGDGPALGKELYYDTASITLGGGEAAEVIIDTAGVAAGTYYLYTTNLNYLSNNNEDFGGMMTEIRIL